MGTQQVSGLFCARTETEGKEAGYLFCSPEVPGTGVTINTGPGTRGPGTQGPEDPRTGDPRTRDPTI